MYFDQYGIIGQVRDHGKIPVEGGDSLNWHSHLRYFTDQPDHETINLFNLKEGAWVRHPDPNNTDFGFGAYYKDPWNGCISRDQLTGILGYLIKFKRRKQLFQLILHHMCWLGLFSYNTIRNGDAERRWKWPDLTGPDIWAMELRGIARTMPGSIILIYPLLVMLDVHIMLNTLFVNKVKVSQEDDVLSYLMKFCVSLEYYPTPMSYLSKKLLDGYGICAKLRSYWGRWRRSPQMAEIQIQYLRENIIGNK